MDLIHGAGEQIALVTLREENERLRLQLLQAHGALGYISMQNQMAILSAALKRLLEKQGGYTVIRKDEIDAMQEVPLKVTGSEDGQSFRLEVGEKKGLVVVP